MSWYYDDDNDYEDHFTLSDYATPSNAIVFQGPLRAESRRGAIGREWWGQHWISAMEELGLDGRLDRGKRYARNGSVLSLEVTHGLAYAEVQGSRSYPYRSAVYLKPFDDNQWDAVLAGLSQQAIYAAKLLAGDMPSDIELVFDEMGLSLFPRASSDIDFECSCPDWGHPCKHTAAVYYLIAEALDRDPFLLFHLRGRTREQILQGLGQPAADAASAAEAQTAPPLTATNFYTDDIDWLVTRMPQDQKVPLALRQLGTAPGDADKGLRKIYHDVKTEARRWLGLD